MNTFGNIFRVSIYGESHGTGVGILLDGIPCGIQIDIEDFFGDLAKRKSGGIGTTKRIEKDLPEILSGIHNGFTTGAPMNIFFRNENQESKVYSDFAAHPRPGHADFVATKKFQGFNDLRGGGHFSGRLTLGIVVAGVVANKIIEKICQDKKIKFDTKIIKLGNLEIKDFSQEITEIKEIKNKIEETVKNGDSLGGIISCKISNLPTGLGEPFFDSIESVLSHLIFSVPGVKGVEFGAGFKGTEKLGSEFNDNFIDESGATSTNNNGGVNGGITNGNPVEFNVAIKPTASIFKSQETFNFKNSKKEKLEIKGRHDVAFILRTPVVIEAISKIGIADFILKNYKS
ncbi:MAG: chorismate synthase [Fusobacteriaceae bacterium]